MKDIYIIDYFINNDISYIFCMPGYFYNLEYEDIKILNNDELINFTIKKSNVFNILYFIEINSNLEQDYKIVVDKLNYTNILSLKKFYSKDVFLQSVIMMKDEYIFIPEYIEYYKTIHHVDRFIIFDNNSSIMQDKTDFLNFIKTRNDVIYIEFNCPYIFIHNDLNINPNFFITAQNSAYSIALKKYNAEWSMFFDLDEYIKSNVSNIRDILRETDPSISAVNIKGYWAGCNKMTKNSFNYRQVNVRSDEICMPKSILRNRLNDYTLMIHYTQFADTTIWFDSKDIYFFHMINLSIKNRNCDCEKYCKHFDKLYILDN